MSVLFFKRFLQRPFQVASIIPSSKALVERVASKMDFSLPRVIAEYGPGEGVHSREIARRMRPGSQLLLFELDADFSRDLKRQFAMIRASMSSTGTPRNYPRSCNAAASRTATTLFPGFPSVFSISKRNAPSCKKPTKRSRPAALLLSTR